MKCIANSVLHSPSSFLFSLQSSAYLSNPNLSLWLIFSNLDCHNSKKLRAAAAAILVMVSELLSIDLKEALESCVLLAHAVEERASRAGG